MPHDVTTHIFLENTSGWGSAREVLASASLDEGFDRPYWYNPNSLKRNRRVEVPKSWSTALADGLIHVLISFDHELKDYFQQVRSQYHNVPPVEVDEDSYLDLVIKIINGLDLGQMEFTVAANRDSCTIRHLPRLKNLTNGVRVLTEVS